MKHIRPVTQGPAKATTTLQVLATFIVAFVDVISNIIFQKNGGAI